MASPTRHGAARARFVFVGSGPKGRLFREFGVPLTRAVRRPRRGGVGREARAGAAAESDYPAEGRVGTVRAKEARDTRLPNRPVDHPADGRGDRPALRGPLPRQPHLAVARGPRLELSQVRAAGPGSGRGGHHALEAGAVAPYRKMLAGVGPIAEIIDDEPFSLLVAPRDPGQLAVAVSRLLGDPALRLAMGVEGRRIVGGRFNIDRNIAQIEQRYDRLGWRTPEA